MPPPCPVHLPGAKPVPDTMPVPADLHDEVAALAIGAAEAVVRNNLDDATQDQLIESYITQVGA